MMSKILIYDWAGVVKLNQYGYEHRGIVEENLQTLVDFFLEKNLKVMISKDVAPTHDYTLFVDNRLFSQR